MKFTHDGRVALVTGGTGNIGTAICRHLTASGARVATCFRNLERAEKWLDLQKKDGFEICGIQADVSNYEDCTCLVQRVEEQLGQVQILVNNAGITRDTTLRKMTSAQWHEVVDINLNSMFNVTRHLVGAMCELGFGRIINISSINGQKGQRGQCNYTATKAGMHGFTMSLAQEVARKGVNVNTVSPGYIETEMVMQVPSSIRDTLLEQIPIGRFGTVDEIASLVDFLASNLSGFITGADFAINGGHHMG